MPLIPTMAWLLVVALIEPAPAADAYTPRAAGTLTFNRDIAPIIFKNCAVCHRPDQAAPFSLLTFADVKKHARDIADVTARRFMPPWLPVAGYGDFADTRRLSADQIGMLAQWANEGAAEGNPAEPPAPPQWSGDWTLGPPDLVLKMPAPYSVPAEGHDIYRNFVLPANLTTTRYVKGYEFRPGNFKAVHHTFIKVDSTSRSRRLAARETTPGFPGMDGPAETPGGHLLGWQPGRLPRLLPAGLAWALRPGDDVVLAMHLNPTGKPETLQPTLGLYFADQPPTNQSVKLGLEPLNFWRIECPHSPIEQKC